MAESTLTDYLASQDDLVREAALALPHQFSQCTYALGNTRQAVYLCLTCPEPRGICSACSIACHTHHEQVELFPKRDFRCDCPTSSIAHPCALETTLHGENESNRYGQNFHGVFCRCGRPYDATKERETMIQCLSCEDWFHESCCNLRERPSSRDPTPEPQTNTEVPVEDTSAEADARSDTSSSSLPAALISASDYESFVCGACVSKIAILKKYAGTPGVMMVVRENKDSSWRRIGDSAAESHENVMVDEEATTLSAGLKRRLSSSFENAPDAKRIRRPTDSSPPALCLAPNHNPIASAIFERSFASDADHELGTGDVFLTDGFRERWCRCEECKISLEEHRYLVDEEETHEPPEDPDSGLSLEELGMRALEHLPRDRAIDGIHAFNKMRDGLKSFLQPFAQEGKVVNETDVRDFFASLTEDRKKGRS